MGKYLIGVALGLVGALALSSTASAAVTGVTLTANATPTKQDKKKRGGVAFQIGIAEAHEGLTFPPGGQGCMPPTVVTPACKYFPPSHTSVINFDPDFKVTPGTIPRCDPASLTGKDATGARAACPGSIVGQGTSEIHTADRRRLRCSAQSPRSTACPVAATRWSSYTWTSTARPRARS